ncbi:MAG TPA: DUF934 domain-containing protein [Steroidobacteraceae bacterium]|jgi:uncharacterized protein (DUF934 family)|nr:DUF934 domain-containing protein [Steroidobacteraceae bacterium]
MRLILKRREFLPDRWRYLGEELAEGDALIVPLAALRTERARWWQWSGRLGVRLAPADAVEHLREELPRLDLVAVEFPGPGDGRGYSAGRLLRERLGFRGELRAVGKGVRQDQVFLLSRCGFDAIELAEGEDREAARRALARYEVAYQPGDAALRLRRQRFFA